MTTPAHPVSIAPRLDFKPWGGRQLAAWCTPPEGDDALGEVLFTAPEATVTSGEHAGMTLGDLARTAPETWVGTLGLTATAGRTIFPFLVKMIDANADLSIQIHPDDRFAAAANLGTGKTEAWHVLDAQAGSVLYLGLTPEATHDDFVRACQRADGSAAGLLRQIRAEPGMTIVVPAGTPHAIGSGLLIYEIQQPSNVTFRLDDWGRVDLLGEPRELHHDDGFAVLDPMSRPMPIERIILRDSSPRRELLAATRYFALERITFEAGDRTTFPAVESPQVLTCHAGSTLIESGAWTAPLQFGKAMVIPAGIDCVLTATESSCILRGWAPDVAPDQPDPVAVAVASAAALNQLGTAQHDDARPAVTPL